MRFKKYLKFQTINLKCQPNHNHFENPQKIPTTCPRKKTFKISFRKSHFLLFFRR